jgi:uncharacterized protein YdeI (YjbR/CyaY-like superfamily)
VVRVQTGCTRSSAGRQRKRRLPGSPRKRRRVPFRLAISFIALTLPNIHHSAPTTDHRPLTTDLPTLAVSSREEWQAWLEENHASAPGVWLKFAKKGAGESTVSRPDALEVALCYGWIDSQARPIDERFWLQRFTPRRRRSKWSRVNRDAVEALIAGGKMKPAGLAEVEAARRDGRWDTAYDSPKTITVPDDLRARLDASPGARATFEKLNSQNRFAILYRIQDAKKPETRVRRIDAFIEMLEQGKKVY